MLRWCFAMFTVRRTLQRALSPGLPERDIDFVRRSSSTTPQGINQAVYAAWVTTEAGYLFIAVTKQFPCTRQNTFIFIFFRICHKPNHLHEYFKPVQKNDSNSQETV